MVVFFFFLSILPSCPFNRDWFLVMLVNFSLLVILLPPLLLLLHIAWIAYRGNQGHHHHHRERPQIDYIMCVHVRAIPGTDIILASRRDIKRDAALKRLYEYNILIYNICVYTEWFINYAHPHFFHLITSLFISTDFWNF